MTLEKWWKCSTGEDVVPSLIRTVWNKAYTLGTVDQTVGEGGESFERLKKSHSDLLELVCEIQRVAHELSSGRLHIGGGIIVDAAKAIKEKQR